jgi:hypothetical protein
MINWEGFRKDVVVLIEELSPNMPEVTEEYRKEPPQFKIAATQTEIQTKHFPSSSLVPCRYPKPLCMLCDFE